MRVLVTWGSKRGGTEGVARTIGETLRAEGCEVDLLPPREAAHAAGFDAVIVGGALYAGHWHHAARKFVSRRQRDLQRVPVWFFSSGPLDDSSDRADIPPTAQVRNLMERVGALGHVTFGGRLAPGARDAVLTAVGFVAVAALLDLVVVAGLVEQSLAMFESVMGTWVPFATIGAVTWTIGELTLIVPPAQRT